MLPLYVKGSLHFSNPFEQKNYLLKNHAAAAGLGRVKLPYSIQN
jgi:hypothetical protein